MANKIFVHTLGDSTLENTWWFLKGDGSNLKDAQEKSVEGQLQKHLGDGFTVVSHAYDGFTTSSVLNGDSIGRVFSSAGDKFQTYIQSKAAYKGARQVYPLAQLSESIKANPTAKHFVVISVGGNDFRESLLNPIQLLNIFPQVQKRYLEIVTKVKSLKGDIQPILMFQYRTSAEDRPYHIYTILGALGRIAVLANIVCAALLGYFGWRLALSRINPLRGIAACAMAAIVLTLSARTIPLKATVGILKGQHPGIIVIGALMEKLYRPILEYAKNEKLPILDLPNIFNPFQKDLYLSEIEPSEQGGNHIANRLATIIQIHAKSSPSTIYGSGSGPNNPEKWTVAYPSK